MNKQVYAMPASKTVKHFFDADGTLVVALDPGNTDFKFSGWGFGSEWWMPHCIEQLADAEWESIAARAAFQTQDTSQTSTFGMVSRTDKDETLYYRVGMEPHRLGRGRRIVGPAKYTDANYMAAIVVAVLRQIKPEGYGKIRLLITHPSNVTAAQLKALVNGVGGKHHVLTPTGERVVYNVKSVVPQEEAICGFQSFLLNNEGAISQMVNFAPGDTVGIIDIGGWISYIGLVEIVATPRGRDIAINTTAPAIQTGIQHVQARLNQLLKADEQLPFGSLNEIPVSIINDALRYDDARGGHNADKLPRYKGTPLPPARVLPNVSDAFGELSNAITQQMNAYFAGGADMSAIVISGGGGGLAYNHMVHYVLDHLNIAPAVADLDRMRYSQVKGLMKGYIAAQLVKG